MFNDGKVTVSLFEPKTTRNVVLTENGKILDKYCTSLKGEQDLNGNFRLTGNFINKDSIFKDIIEGAILKVRNEYDEDEIFRITTITPTPFLISVIAFQITITDTKTLWLEDVRPTNLTGMAALQHMYNGSNSMGFPKEIILTSDIDITNTAYYQLMNLHDALFTCDQSFINRWGGETYRHQYNLTINKQIGAYNGVVIRENKNLVGFEANKSTDNLCTVAVGKGYDGILGDYIESPLKNKYDRAYTKVIEYSDVKVKTDSDINEDDDTMLFDTLEEAKAELNKRIKNEFKNNKIDEIQATYDIDFLELSKTEEYKDYVQAERLYLGDFLDVIVDSLDIKIKTRVISKEIDYLQNRVTKMTVSNIPVESMSKTDSQIVGNIRDILSKNNNIDLGNYVDTVIKSGMKNSNVVVRKNEILIMDTDDIKTAKNVWRWNGEALAHSSTGYYGKYNDGFTKDGILSANIIQTGILRTILLESLDGSCSINLKNGEIYFNKGLIKGKNSEWNLDTGEFKSKLDDGSEIVISPKEGFYNKFGDSKSTYHHLSYKTFATIPPHQGDLVIQLPSEFKGKRFQVLASIVTIAKDEVIDGEVVRNVGVATSWDIKKGTITPASTCELYNVKTGKFRNMPCWANILVIC